MPESHLLVEGGPVHRRVGRWLAVLTGLVIGIGFGAGAIGIVALTAAKDAHQAVREVKDARAHAIVQVCREANERHDTALAGLTVLAVSSAPKNPTLAEAAQRKQVLLAFVNALAPAYDCALRVREQTKP
jgi:hypothetical protein